MSLHGPMWLSRAVFGVEDDAREGWGCFWLQGWSDLSAEEMQLHAPFLALDTWCPPTWPT